MPEAFLRRPQLLALVSVLLLWLASPGGADLWPLLFVGLVPLLAAVQVTDNRRAFFAGGLTGLLYFLLLLYWLVIVLGRYGGLPLYISVPALFLLAAYMAVYLALFAVMARQVLVQLPPLAALFVLPACWVGLDWLRGTAFSGFPWMDLGYGLWEMPRLIQLADLFGHFGITYLLLLVNCLVALLFSQRLAGRGRLQLIVPVGVVLLAAALYSHQRYRQVAQAVVEHDDVRRVAVVQGNIDQGVKWSPDYQQKTLKIYLDQTIALFGDKRPTLVVWPETALPFYLTADSHLGPLAGLTAQYDVALLSGAPWYEVIDRQAGQVRYYNSALLLEPDGRISGKYAKTHLVPFGEYVPMRRLLPFLAPLVEAVGDFSSGTIDQPLYWHEARVGVLICFESIFPDIARQWVMHGANVLVNLTNDAWYGKSSAPHHSMAMSVFRAVETRRSLVRSANTGISGFVDPLGRVMKASPIFQPWAAAEDVALHEEVTWYVRYGHLFAPLCLVVGVAVVIVVSIRGRRSASEPRSY